MSRNHIKYFSILVFLWFFYGFFNDLGIIKSRYLSVEDNYNLVSSIEDAVFLAQADMTFLSDPYDEKKLAIENKVIPRGWMVRSPLFYKKIKKMGFVDGNDVIRSLLYRQDYYVVSNNDNYLNSVEWLLKRTNSGEFSRVLIEEGGNFNVYRYSLSDSL